MFVDWEARPALFVSASAAFAVLKPGAGWVAVEPAEVGLSGRVVGSLAALEARFGPLPPLPAEARLTLPSSP